jgi:acyl-CoA thioesterase II
VDARTFLGIEPGGEPNHWQLPVHPSLTTPGQFLFGGCGLGAALVALEGTTGRPAIWATAQYVAYAKTGSVVDYEVVLSQVGGHVTQARAIGRVDGEEIISVNGAFGSDDSQGTGVWVSPPEVPAPESCPERRLPSMMDESIFDRIETRIAIGTGFEQIGRIPATPHSALWARIQGHLDSSAATLAIFGDYLTGGVSQALGQRVMARSLDNTLRVVRLSPGPWVLCDMHIHAVAGGYAQGIAYLWSEDGTFLGTASQSMAVRPWDGRLIRANSSDGGHPDAH